MSESMLAAGDKRSEFLHDHLGKKPHLLYLWQVADEHQILSHVVSKMDPKVAASGKSAAATADVQ